MSDNNWFSKAGSLGDSLDCNKTSIPTSVEPATLSKDSSNPNDNNSNGSTFIKPVKGLKGVSSVSKNTRNDSTPVKHSTFIKREYNSKNAKNKKVSNNSLFAKNKKPIIVVAVCLLIVAAIILFFIENKHNNGDMATEANNSVENPNSGQNYTEYSVEYPDVEKYFNDNSTVVSVDNVGNSDNVFAESEVYRLLNDRGFTGDSITSEYSMNGEYLDQTEISSSSSTKHPTYQTYYINSSGDLWLIMVIGRQVMAMSISYTLNHPNATTILISESNEITSYDSSSNSFYKTIPNKSVMDVRVYDRIDASLLASLTSEDLINEKNR